MPSTNSIKQDIIQWFIATVKDHLLNSHTWYFDSGATQYMTSIKEYFITYMILNPPLKVYSCDDQVHHTIGKGTIHINLNNGQTTTVHDVLHIPVLVKSLISVCKATIQCQSIDFFSQLCYHRA
jgi:hypothetical protein